MTEGLEAEWLRAAASPTDKSRKDGGLPPVTSEKPHDPRVVDIACQQFDAPSRNIGVSQPFPTTSGSV
jgi:hypothetical protein